MIHSAKLNKYGSHPCNNYHEVMEYFTDKFLHSDDPEEGYEFMELFSAYIDGSKFPCDKIVLNAFTGSISEIFDRYTTINDRLKYCNGHYFRFKDGNVSELYSIFTKCYKGNYFLNNAVKRGVIID